MRVFLGILLLTLGFLPSMAQVVVTGKYQKQPIAKVLAQWSDKYSIDFAYDSFELAQYSFTGEFEELPLERALLKLLSDTPYLYRWLNNTCIIFPSGEVSVKPWSEDQVTSVISGVVKDRLNRESLPFASVTALVANFSSSTDADGRFTIMRKTDVEFDTLVVSYLGYVQMKFPFKWNETNGMLNVELIPSGSLLPDVEVRASSVKPLLFDNEPATFTVNPNLSGLRYGVGEADVFRTAQFAPGVSGVQENNNGLFIRGSSSDQTQLLFDGFNIYHQDHFLGMFSSLNALAVKSMRIHKCLTHAELGGRAAGVVEVIGREGDLRRPTAIIDAGTMSISGSLETPLDTAGKASLFLSGRRSVTEWIKGPAYKELFNTLYSASIVSEKNELPAEKSDLFDPQLVFQDFNAKFTYKSSVKDVVHVSFYASRDDVNFSYADTSSAELVDVTDVRYSDEAVKVNRGASARWKHRVSPRLELFSSVGYSAFQGVYFSTDSIRNNLFAVDSTRFEYRDVLLNDLTVMHHWRYKTSNHTFTFGGVYNHIVTSEKTRAQSELEFTESRSGSIVTVFAGDEWRMARWLIQPAFRLNLYSKESATVFPEPKLAVSYRLFNNSFFLKAAAVRSVQFLQRITNQSLYQNVPDQWRLSDSSLPVLKADQVMFGANWTPGNWNIDVELYSKRTQGQVLNSTAGQYTNTSFDAYYVGVANIQGIDAGVQWEHVPHRILCSVSRSWAESNYENFELQEIQETYFRGAEGKLVYEWKKNAWNASIVFLAAQGNPYTALLGTYTFPLPDGSSAVFPLFGGYNRARTDAYFRTDIALGYRWQWHRTQWQFNTSIYNVFDAQNYRAVQYSVSKATADQLSINQRKILMLGRIPSINLTCRF